MRRLRTAVIAAGAACCVAVSALPAAAATPAPPQDKLTTLEYTQISALFAGVVGSTRARSIDWNAAKAACEKAGTTTPLLATQRTSCLASINTLTFVQKLAKDEKTCGSGHGSTTGIAASAGSAARASRERARSALSQIVCVAPDFRQLTKLAAEMYSQDVAARQQAVARGFSGVCLETLVETPSQLVAERRFALTTKTLSADVNTLAKLASKGGSASKTAAEHVDTDLSAFAQDFAALSNGPALTKVSVCPHQ